MKNDPSVRNFNGSQAGLYPHLKITNEAFPRVLATRRIEDDGAEYFGAFLTRTAARVLIDFLNRVLRLRSCDITVDGKFPVPCTQHYHRRCVAPCVESLTAQAEYLEIVELVRLFLANSRDELTARLQAMIKNASDSLDFETAAYRRDILESVRGFWSNSRWNVWLDDAVDTYTIERADKELIVYLVTQRGRNVLGRKVFRFTDPLNADEAMTRIISGFYRRHLPREIRISHPVENSDMIEAELSERFARPARIMIDRSARRPTTQRAIREMRSEAEIDAARPVVSPAEIGHELRRMFALRKAPERIEAFDVAHISSTRFVAASAVWVRGLFAGSEYSYSISGQRSEPSALAEAVVHRVTAECPPDLVLVDGGKAQLSAASIALDDAGSGTIEIAAAAKPLRKPGGISYFLLRDGRQVAYDRSRSAHRILKLLRDDAHELANRVHRDLRDMAHNYELAAVLPSIDEAARRRLLVFAGTVTAVVRLSVNEIEKIIGPEATARAAADLESYRQRRHRPAVPLIVPIRFDDPDGGADDLRPIVTR